MLMVMAVVLAIASALRYYFVITLGERIVSDLRRDVFAHVTRLSPSFFDVNQSGEIVSAADGRYDADQVRGRRHRLRRAPQPDPCFGAMGMMVVTSPKLSSLVLGAIP